MKELHMNRINILSIGRDSSVLEEGSQLHRRFQVYDTYHSFVHVVMNPGDRKEIRIGESTVVLAGGTSLVGAFISAYKEVKKQLQANDCALVTTQDVLYAGLLGYVFARKNKLPLYVQVHGDHLDNERWFKSEVGKFNRVMNMVGKYIVRRADHVRAVSERLKSQLVKNYGIPAERIISIPIGTDLSLFAATEVAGRKRSIFFAQRLIHEKCPMLFAEVVTEVMEEFSDVTVEIAGDGFMRKEMEKYFKEHDMTDRVTFLGQVTQQELARLYSTAYCYLHTADWEGWGMPMIEAMASGCPVVTTDTGCAGEAVRDGMTGFVTEINDRDALVEKTKRLFSDSHLWKELSENSKKEAQTWSFASLAEKNMQWYADVQDGK